MQPTSRTAASGAAAASIAGLIGLALLSACDASPSQRHDTSSVGSNDLGDAQARRDGAAEGRAALHGFGEQMVEARLSRLELQMDELQAEVRGANDLRTALRDLQTAPAKPADAGATGAGDGLPPIPLPPIVARPEDFAPPPQSRSAGAKPAPQATRGAAASPTAPSPAQPPTARTAKPARPTESPAARLQRQLAPGGVMAQPRPASPALHYTLP